MMEDGKIFDYESDWHPCQNGDDKLLYYVNDSLSTLFRIIDVKKRLYTFSDIGRVKRIRDINRILTKDDDEESNKNLYQSIVNRILDEIYPIEMPYIPQILTCFIEVFKDFSSGCDVLGILYFRDETNGIEDSEMIECKHFYRIHQAIMLGKPVYEEIEESVYVKLKEKFNKGEKPND